MTACAVLCALLAAWLVYRGSAHQRLGPRLVSARWRWCAGMLGVLAWALPVPALGWTAALALALSALMAGLAALPFVDAAWHRWRGRHAL